MSASLKIPRDKFLARLEDKLARSIQAEKNRAAAQEEHNKKLNAHMTSMLKLAAKDQSIITTSHVQYDGTISLLIKAPTDAPKFVLHDDPDYLGTWERNELESYIKLVELSESEFIPASLHKNALRFL